MAGWLVLASTGVGIGNQYKGRSGGAQGSLFIELTQNLSSWPASSIDSPFYPRFKPHNPTFLSLFPLLFHSSSPLSCSAFFSCFYRLLNLLSFFISPSFSASLYTPLPHFFFHLLFTIFITCITDFLCLFLLHLPSDEYFSFQGS